MKKNIQGVEEKQSAKGTYLKVTWDDGKADNVFKKEHIDVIRVAQKDNLTVEVTKEKQGQYWNVTNVVLPSPFTEKPTPTSSSAPASVPSSPANKPAPVKNGDSNKDRSVMLSYAKDLATAGVLDVAKITDKADEFLTWLNK